MRYEIVHHQGWTAVVVDEWCLFVTFSILSSKARPIPSNPAKHYFKIVSMTTTGSPIMSLIWRMIDLIRCSPFGNLSLSHDKDCKTKYGVTLLVVTYRFYISYVISRVETVSVIIISRLIDHLTIQPHVMNIYQPQIVIYWVKTINEQ